MDKISTTQLKLVKLYCTCASTTIRLVHLLPGAAVDWLSLTGGGGQLPSLPSHRFIFSVLWVPDVSVVMCLPPALLHRSTTSNWRRHNVVFKVFKIVFNSKHLVNVLFVSTDTGKVVSADTVPSDCGLTSTSEFPPAQSFSFSSGMGWPPGVVLRWLLWLPLSLALTWLFKKKKEKKTKKKQNNEGKLQRGAAQLPSNKAQWQDCALSLSPYLSLCFITLSFC